MTAPPIDAAAASDDAALAAALAEGAGRILLALRARADAGEFPDGAALRAAGDAESQRWLAAELARVRPDDCILSEEAADDPRRLQAERVWIIDPLDGTREFGERTDEGAWREDFAVHVALWRRDAGLAVAAVALPARGIVHRAGLGSPPAGDGGRTRAPVGTPLRVAVSRTRAPAVATALSDTGLAELVRLGSAGFKVMAVVEGAVDAYVHAGGQYEWDTAAPVAVALEAGMIATRLDGSPISFNQPSPWCPDLVVCRPAVQAILQQALDGAAPATADLAVQPT